MKHRKPDNPDIAETRGPGQSGHIPRRGYVRSAGNDPRTFFQIGLQGSTVSQHSFEFGHRRVGADTIGSMADHSNVASHVVQFGVNPVKRWAGPRAAQAVGTGATMEEAQAAWRRVAELAQASPEAHATRAEGGGTGAEAGGAVAAFGERG